MKHLFAKISIKYGLGIALLAYVILSNWMPAPGSDSPGLRDVLSGPIRFSMLAAAALICLVSVLITFVRWHLLVRIQSLPFTLAEATRLGAIGFFFGTFLPGAVGGDIVKAAVIARQQDRRTLAVATVIMDRVMALWALVWLVALLGGAFWALGNSAVRTDQRLQSIVLGAAAIVAGTASCWFLLGVLPARYEARLRTFLASIPKVGPTIAELWLALWMYRCQTRKLALALLLSLVSHGCYIVSFYLAAQVFQGSQATPIPSLAEHFLLVPNGMLIQTMFPAPGGMGAAEFGYGKLYALVGYPEAGGVLACLAMRAICWAVASTGYAVHLACPPRTRGRGLKALGGGEKAGLAGRYSVTSQQSRDSQLERPLHAKPSPNL